MRAKVRATMRPASMAVAALSLMLQVVSAAFSAPVAGAAPGPLPATGCTSAAGVATCDLWAKTGTVTLPGATGPTAIWGYASTTAGPATTPGPVLVVTQGDAVTVHLHNGLAQASSLAIPAVQGFAPDTAGAPAGGAKDYSFTATRPGTFVYEAGLTPDGTRQVAMGLVGALIVRSNLVANSGYGTAESTFTDEAVLVMSEIDPLLNANPAAFDLRNFAPKYRLLNGKVFPNTDPIATAAGNAVLLRYVNAGVLDHSIGVLGVHQRVLANDGRPLGPAHSYLAVAETVPAGQTLDTIITMPAAPAGTRYGLYEPANHLDNAGVTAGAPQQLAFGGMLTFLTTGTVVAGADTVGPAASNPAVAPSPTNGTVPVNLSVNLSDTATGNSNITAAEYFIDTPGAAGAGIALSAAFGTPAVTATATISTATLSGLASGNHTIYMHGKDQPGNWGPVTSTVLNLAKGGPTTSGVTLTPNPANGGVGVILSATCNASGGGVTAAEYRVDTTLGAGTPMTVNSVGDATVAASYSLTPAQVAALTPGPHTFNVRSRDNFNTWGPDAAGILRVDKTGPAASAVSVSPSPNNGTVSYWTSPGNARVFATLTDPVAATIQSNVVDAEGFLDAIGANGAGFHFLPSDGLFDSPTENGYADIPLSTVNNLAAGAHPLSVHGRDAAGNWGAFTAASLVVDKTAPTVSGVTATPNPVSYLSSTTLTATATDTPASVGTVAAAEWYEAPDPGVGNGHPMSPADGTFNSATEGLTASIPAGTWPLGALGAHTVFVRARDAATNWGAAASVVVTVVGPNPIFSNGFEPAQGGFSAWNGGATGSPAHADINAAASMGGTASNPSTVGMRNTESGANTPGYVTDNTPTAEPTYHASFWFNPVSLTTNSNAVDLFAGRTATGTTVFRVQYRTTGVLLTGRQVRIGVRGPGGDNFSAWSNLNSGPHVIRLDWAAATAGSGVLSIDGAAVQTVSTNTSTYRLDSVLLGLSGGLGTGRNGQAYFDTFTSTRNTLP